MLQACVAQPFDFAQGRLLVLFEAWDIADIPPGVSELSIHSSRHCKMRKGGATIMEVARLDKGGPVPLA